MIYIFDVDGTLTPSRGKMNTEFAEFFVNFVDNNECYLITGSDRDKTLEQIPKEIYDKFIEAYQCSGNHIFQGDTEVYKNDWILPDTHRKWLLNELYESKFYSKKGDHFDQRVGLLNFSILGRNGGIEGRAMYKQWDEHKKERENIVKRFNDRWFKREWWNRKKWNDPYNVPDSNLIIATVAGETGIDITPEGMGKEQILKNFDAANVTFFGDKTEEGGNDYTIAYELRKKGGTIVEVNSWEDTYKCLQKIENGV